MLRKHLNLHIEIYREEGDICERRDQENDAKEIMSWSEFLDVRQKKKLCVSIRFPLHYVQFLIVFFCRGISFCQ